MKKKFLFLCLFLFQTICAYSESDGFQIMLVNVAYNSCDTFYVFDYDRLDSVNWENQIYYVNRKCMNEIENFPFGSSTMQFVFLFNGQEIYRAAAMSRYNSNKYPKGVAAYRVYEEFDGEKEKTFKNDAISVTFFEKASVNENLFEKAHQFLKEKGLIIDT